MEIYDFSGWATRNNLRCSDGRTIRKDAFKHHDGQTVPLVWSHQHNDPSNVLGHALLENRDEGVYAYCAFNDNPMAQEAKNAVLHGDVNQLSIYANQLRQNGGDVMHGMIREVSLVLAGANPGAFIDSVIKHGEASDEDAVIYTGEYLTLAHSDDYEEEDDEMDNEKQKIYNSMTEEQRELLHDMVGRALDDDDDDEFDEEYDEYYDDEEGDGEDMKHNLFDNEYVEQDNVLTHADQEFILEMAKNNGSFRNTFAAYVEDNDLQHDAVSGGFAQDGEGNVTALFPDHKDLRPGAPELVTNDQGWVGTVMSKVHKSPLSRIRTSHVDIRNIDALRAKGYVKGKEKALSGNFNLARRTTDPQTVYVKNALHRDDILDITDFDYVQYLYNIDKMMLNEELATAIMLGDGREVGDPDKISEEHIRPIWTDDDLYTIHVDIDFEKAKTELQGTGTSVSFGENYIKSEAMTNTVLYAKENYKGSGTPDLFITPHDLNVMLLARDMNGRRIYSSKEELASTLGVGRIYTAEQFAGKTRTTKDGKVKKLTAIIVNLNDYHLGATKGGQVTHFTQFDIDFNQQKSLLETRCSGALTKLYSAIAIEELVESAAG